MLSEPIEGCPGSGKRAKHVLHGLRPRQLPGAPGPAPSARRDAAPPAARPDAAAPISGARLRDDGPRFAATKKPPEERRLRDRPATHAVVKTPTPDERTRQKKRRGGVRAGAGALGQRQGESQDHHGPRAAAAQRPESGQGPGAPDVCARREDEAAPPRARGRRRGRRLGRDSKVLLLRAHVRGKGATDDPQHWVVYIVRDAREGASAKADAAARALREAPWPQRVRVLDGVRPPPSLCGACVAADCGGAPCRDHARPGLQKETMATVAAPGAFDVYAVKLPSAGCVPPCPRCGASAGHAAPPSKHAPRLYRLASRFADGGRFPSSKRCARALRAAAVREGGCDRDAAPRTALAVGAYACAGTENDEASVAAFCRARAALRAAPGAASAALVAGPGAPRATPPTLTRSSSRAAARAADHAAAASKVRAAPAAARFAANGRCPSPRRRRAPEAISMWRGRLPQVVGFLESTTVGFLAPHPARKGGYVRVLSLCGAPPHCHGPAVV